MNATAAMALLIMSALAALWLWVLWLMTNVVPSRDAERRPGSERAGRALRGRPYGAGGAERRPTPGEDTDQGSRS
ncbi:MAG: hypothetical protein GEV11_14265 [Streptosporangiales bacterium]|nr:hypothetical protein [Streptosporangiales bacterium]